MTTEVTILGPNLSAKNSTKGDLHVHATGCRHIATSYTTPDRANAYTVKVDTAVEVAEVIYSDFGGEMERYLGEFWFAPCVEDLPTR